MARYIKRKESKIEKETKLEVTMALMELIEEEEMVQDFATVQTINRYLIEITYADSEEE